MAARVMDVYITPIQVLLVTAFEMAASAAQSLCLGQGHVSVHMLAIFAVHCGSCCSCYIMEMSTLPAKEK